MQLAARSASFALVLSRASFGPLHNLLELEAPCVQEMVHHPLMETVDSMVVMVQII